jgi:methyltransferase (TIGR00027 family)
MEAQRGDDAVEGLSGFGTAYLRALESARPDRILNDAFAELLTQPKRAELESLLETPSKQVSLWGDLVAIRSRYVDEALKHRDPRVRQVMILGAGLDTRAYRLESIRGCSVWEIDQSAQAFDYKHEVFKSEHAQLVATNVHYIDADLTKDDWDGKLFASGYNRRVPTFWVMEGLLPYLEHSSILRLLEAIDAASAPGSELWADMYGPATFNFARTGDFVMKFSEVDPLHGVLSAIPWCLKLQASLESERVHFGRTWTPLASAHAEKSVPVFFIRGKKPIPTEPCEKDVCPGLAC